MKEYAMELGEQVDLNQLVSEKLPTNYYSKAHESLVILCHDVFIEYDGGILLVKRKNYPAKEIYWPVGGRVKRGVPVEISLKHKVKEETGLNLFEIRYLGKARTFFSTEPFGHHRGTDTLNLVFNAKADGNLNLDKYHFSPTIFSKEDVISHADDFHPYVKDFISKIFSRDKIS